MHLIDDTCTATRHGTSTAYTNGCRCTQARAAKAKAQRDWVKRRYLNRGPLYITACPSQNKIKALVRIGWTEAAIGQRAGYTQRWTAAILRRELIHTDTAGIVDVLYAELGRTSGPSALCRARAANRGWPHPSDLLPDGLPCQVLLENVSDIDEVAVQRVVNGETQHLNRSEKYAAYTAMRRKGLPGNEIAARLHINGQTQKVYSQRYDTDREAMSA